MLSTVLFISISAFISLTFYIDFAGKNSSFHVLCRLTTGRLFGIFIEMPVALGFYGSVALEQQQIRLTFVPSPVIQYNNRSA
jgi:hypothetical protein